MEKITETTEVFHQEINRKVINNISEFNGDNELPNQAEGRKKGQCRRGEDALDAELDIFQIRAEVEEIRRLQKARLRKSGKQALKDMWN